MSSQGHAYAAALGSSSTAAKAPRSPPPATRIIEDAQSQRRRINLRDALVEAGIKPFALGKAEAQLRQLGRARGAKLYRWLLEADLALKGSSSSPPRARLVLEQLIARLAKPMAASRDAVAH